MTSRDRLRWAAYGALCLAAYYRLRARLELPKLIRELVAYIEE